MEIEKELKKEIQLLNKLDKRPVLSFTYCFNCKHYSKGYCNCYKKHIKVTYRKCRFYNKIKEITKTKSQAIERWNKFLNDKYYYEHKKELSKSQLDKVDKWRATHKTIK